MFSRARADDVRCSAATSEIQMRRSGYCDDIDVTLTEFQSRLWSSLGSVCSASSSVSD